jgi:hypothetical protein
MPNYQRIVPNKSIKNNIKISFDSDSAIVGEAKIEEK